jgi:alpha-amylase
MRRRILTIVCAAAATLGSLVGGSAVAAPVPRAGQPADQPDQQPAGQLAGTADTIVHLFEWNWSSIGRECASVLGPQGYGAVQVSPPQEHVVLPGRGYPWWQDYQPVSYQLGSRRGDRAAFAAMVSTCHAAGVKIYVDAVLNHMTGSNNSGGLVGSAGNPFSAYDYPGVAYSRNDFHDPCEIKDYTNRGQVQGCQLSSLADLRTESPYVRTKLAGYLKDLTGLGVDGFRLDAAKHIALADVLAIEGEAGGSPYVYQEVIEGGPGEIGPAEYVGAGDVTDFRYGDLVGDAFRAGSLSGLNDLPGRMAVSSDAAQVFIDNHDTERSGRTKLNYASGDRYYLAEGFMLAYPFGTPSVMSGYAFASSDQGPPSDSVGKATDASCGTGTWTCQHRDPRIAGMVGLRNASHGQAVSNWWSDGGGQIAFGRGAFGYAVFNTGTGSLTRTFSTSLPAGTYCDVMTGQLNGGACTGQTVTVAADGTFTATVGANRSLALHVGARATGTSTSTTVAVAFNATVTTTFGQNVYVGGSTPALGGWDPARAVALSSAAYPIWKGTVPLPAGSGVEYKYLKKNPDGTIIWESDPNRARSVPAGGALTVTDTWR